MRTDAPEILKECKRKNERNKRKTKKSSEEQAITEMDPEEFGKTHQQCPLEEVAELVPPETPVDATALAMPKESKQLCNESDKSDECDNRHSKQNKVTAVQ